MRTRRRSEDDALTECGRAKIRCGRERKGGVGGRAVVIRGFIELLREPKRDDDDDERKKRRDWKEEEDDAAAAAAAWLHNEIGSVVGSQSLFPPPNPLPLSIPTT